MAKILRKLQTVYETSFEAKQKSFKMKLKILDGKIREIDEDRQRLSSECRHLRQKLEKRNQEVPVRMKGMEQEDKYAALEEQI